MVYVRQSSLSSGRQHLLNVARGLLRRLDNNHASLRRQRVLRCFPLTDQNVRTPQLTTPNDFHKTLCRLISSAKHRVYLASLYVGPAASPSSSCKELELLTALQATSAPKIKILLDKNRAKRLVPKLHIDRSPNNRYDEQTVSSAEACFQALQSKISRLDGASSDTSTTKQDSGVYLLSVLPTWQQLLLRNPYNEVAGVFHLKCYIIDDDIIFTGANLSEEYFCDRIDRYLWLTTVPTLCGKDIVSKNQRDHTNDLVEFYVKLIDTLCQYADPYTSTNTDIVRAFPPRVTKMELLNNLVELLTTSEPAESITRNDHIDNPTIEDIASSPKNPVVAYAIPTFQAPRGFIHELHSIIPSDTEIMSNLIQTFSETDNNNSRSFQIRLASAYLNLTDLMIETMGKCRNTYFQLLTAGYTSHGFKPNLKKVGNKGKSWIPAVFDVLGRRCVEALQITLNRNHASAANLWYYQREGWTFHAKGMWLTTKASTTNKSNLSNFVENETEDIIDDPNSICVAVHGSGNYGERSAVCDMESNLIFIFSDRPKPNENRLKKIFQNDWNDLCKYARLAKTEQAQPLSHLMRTMLPLIKRYF
jgi:CDP-diacylglycerol---glycerol-3-phosphate 3-phosphatidyltransferase